MNHQTLDFYRGKRVFITGHTGFKGTWLCMLLLKAGAEVTGYSLPAPTKPSLFELIGLEHRMSHVIGDVRNLDAFQAAFNMAQPEIVFHLAAQPIVREGYRDPVGTYHTNVMGTVHLLECVRQSHTVRSVVNVTTDKVYQNNQWPWGYREIDSLDGFDPYANSKSCSELVTQSYRRSFFQDCPVAVSTARAGNVIGGGDFAPNRIVPDCVRAVQMGVPVQLRNPHSVRPYQHVLDPLSAYMLIAQRQCEQPESAGCYNVGPKSGDCITTGKLAELFCQVWGPDARWEQIGNDGPNEDVVLKLDCDKIRSVLGWQPKWNVRRAVEETVAWTKSWLNQEPVAVCMEQQIESFIKG